MHYNETLMIIKKVDGYP